MKLVLIGFMGSGKSTVGALLAGRLNVPLIELDDLILAASGRNSINDIFAGDGEEHFRALESEAAAQAAAYPAGIISTGGGIVTRASNIERLQRGGWKIVLLTASFEEIRQRLSDDCQRPLFRDLDSARRLYDARLPLYERHADWVVNTDRRSAAEVVEEVLRISGSPK